MRTENLAEDYIKPSKRQDCVSTNRRMLLFTAWGLASLGLAAPMSTSAQEINRPPNGSLMLSFSDAPRGMWFHPITGGRVWSFYPEVSIPESPATSASDDGQTLHQILMDGPTRSVGIDLRFNQQYQPQIKNNSPRTAIWFPDLTPNSQVLVLDADPANANPSEVIENGDLGFAGLLLPDTSLVMRVRVIRPEGSINPIKAVIGALSAEDTQRPLLHTIKDLAHTFNLPASIYPEIAPQPTIKPPEPLKDLPRFKFEEVASRPEWYGRWFLGADSQNQPWNNAIAFRLPHPLDGVFYRSGDGIGKIMVSNRANSPVFDIDMQLNPLLIENYALVEGRVTDGTEPALFLNTQPKSEIFLLDNNRREQFNQNGARVLAKADRQGNAVVILPRQLTQLRLRVKLAEPRLPVDSLLGFGPKLTNYNPDPQSVLGADGWGVPFDS